MSCPSCDSGGIDFKTGDPCPDCTGTARRTAGTANVPDGATLAGHDHRPAPSGPPAPRRTAGNTPQGPGTAPGNTDPTPAPVTHPGATPAHNPAAGHGTRPDNSASLTGNGRRNPREHGGHWGRPDNNENDNAGSHPQQRQARMRGNPLAAGDKNARHRAAPAKKRTPATRLRTGAANSAAKAKESAAKLTRKGLSVGMVMLMLILVPSIGAGALILMVAGPAFAGDDILPPKPTTAQCQALPQGWCEVLWATQVETKNSGGTPVPWSILAGIAKSQTEFARYSPNDSVDRDPDRADGIGGMPSGAASGAAQQASTNSGRTDTYLLGDSLADGTGPYLKRDKRLKVTVNAKTGRQLTEAITTVIDPNSTNGGGTIAAKGSIADTVVVDLGTNGIDNYAANIDKLMTLMSGHTVYWLTLHAVGSGGNKTAVADNGNKILTQAVAKWPNLKLIDAASAVRTHPGWLAGDGVHLSAKGYKARAKLIADTIADSGGEGSGTSATSPNTENAVDNAPANIPAAAATGTGTPLTLPLKDLWTKYYNGKNFHTNSSLWSLGFHTGQDFSAPTGTPIYAVADSTVIGASFGASGTCGNSGQWGNAVVLKVNDGSGAKEVSYNHLSAISVTKGQKVAAGQLLGKTGATGHVTGAHLHFEVRNAGTCPWTGDPEKSLVDPVPWLKGARAGSPAGTDIANAGTSIGGDNTPANIPDTPEWMSAISSVDDDNAEHKCPVDTISPSIDGANGSQGAYLLNSYETEQMRNRGWDPQNVCQASLYTAEALRHNDDIGEVASAHDERHDTVAKYTAFWTDALEATDLFVAPTADDTNCSTIPEGMNTAEKISWAIGCYAGKHKKVSVIDTVDGTTPHTLGTTASVNTLRDEAVTAAAAYSGLGTAPCDNNATYAGVFGLTKQQAAAIKIDGDPVDRCDIDDNILAAANLLVTAESVPVNKRSADAGPYAPMLGGWAQFGWAFGGADKAAQFARTGPHASWSPEPACVTAIDGWLTALTVDGTPLASANLTSRPGELNTVVTQALAGVPNVEANSACANKPNTVELYRYAAGQLTNVETAARNTTAVTNLSAWLNATKAPASTYYVSRLSGDGTTVPVAPDADTDQRDDAPDPLGIAAHAKDIAAYSQGIAGGPVDGKWQTPNFNNGCFTGTSSAAGVTIVGGAGKYPGMVYRALKTKGFTDEGAAGILGNLQQESNVNPKSVESNGEGYGLVQWSFERKTSLINFAKKNNKPWQDVDLQIDFLFKELEAGYKPLIAYLQKTTDVTEATVKFENQFERAGIKMMDKRIAYAKGHFKQIKAGKYGTPAGAASPATVAASSNAGATFTPAVAPAAPATPAAAGGLSTPAKNSEDKLQPATVALLRLVETKWPYFAKSGRVGGYRQDPYPDHPSGQALDIMIPNDGRTAQSVALGEEIAAFLKANYKKLAIHQVIFRQRIWNEERDHPNTWRKMGDRNNWTDNHMNHIHALVYGDRTSAAASLATPGAPTAEVAVSNASCGTGVAAGGGGVVVDGDFEPYIAKMEAFLGKSSINGHQVNHRCLQNVEDVWEMVGGSTSNGRMASAAIMGEKLKRQGKLQPMTKGFVVPRGMLVFWNSSIGGGSGHVAIADGKGNTVNNWGSDSVQRNKMWGQAPGSLMGWGPPTMLGKAGVKKK